MDVNFDGLRKHLINDYNSLIKKLNRGICTDAFDNTDSVFVETDNISRELDGIRNGLITLAFMYQDGEDGFVALDENTHFETFNPNDEK